MATGSTAVLEREPASQTTVVLESDSLVSRIIGQFDQKNTAEFVKTAMDVLQGANDPLRVGATLVKVFQAVAKSDIAHLDGGGKLNELVKNEVRVRRWHNVLTLIEKIIGKGRIFFENPSRAAKAGLKLLLSHKAASVDDLRESLVSTNGGPTISMEALKIFNGIVKS